MQFSDQTIIEIQELLDQIAAGDESALGPLIARAETRLRELAQRMLWRYPKVKRWEDTDDVFQASVIRLHRSLSETKPETINGFFGLAATQIRRTLIDLARHYYGVYGVGSKHHTDAAGRAADDPEGPLHQAPVHQTPAHRTPVQQTWRGNSEPVTLEEWTAFHEATSQLPDEERQVFELAWYGGLKRKEIADVIAVSERTVTRRLVSARLLLKKILTSPDATSG